jgi:hypothetical protein
VVKEGEKVAGMRRGEASFHVCRLRAVVEF